MQITSSAFGNEAPIPTKYTCEGADISPPLEFHNVPEGARSLALVVDDPDAATDPKGSGTVFVHWVVFNISPQVKELAEGSLAEGAIQGVNGRGEAEYMGPCPPTGVHRYFFKLYALANPLDLPGAVTKQALLEALEGQVLAQAELIGTYQKTATK